MQKIQYFQGLNELEDLRTEQQEEYNISEATA
jgi:hypothetical protein